MPSAKVLGYVLLTLQYDRDGRKWVGRCVELSTSTFANTLKQTRVELEDAVIAHLNCLEEEGERERFFKEHGITLHRTIPKKEVTVRVPPRDWGAAPEVAFPYGGFFQPRLYPISPRALEPVGV